MAQAEDRMMIGVEYTGAQAIQAFGQDMKHVPTEVQEAIAGLGAAGGNERILATRLAKMAELGVAAVKLELGQLQGVVQGALANVSVGGPNFGSNIARAMGITEQTPRVFAEVSGAMNRAYQTLRQQQERRAQGDEQYYNRIVAGERRVEEQLNRSAAAFVRQRVEQEKLNRVPTPVERQIKTIATAPLSNADKHYAMQQVLAAPVAPKPITYDPLTRLSMNAHTALSASDSRRDAEIALSLGQGHSYDKIAKEFDTGYPAIQRVERAYSDLIRAARRQAEAFDEVVAETKRMKSAEAAYADRLMTFNRLAANAVKGGEWDGLRDKHGVSSRTGTGVGASIGMGARITPWEMGTSAYWQTAMGQRFAAQLGMRPEDFGAHQPMPAAGAGWWEAQYAAQRKAFMAANAGDLRWDNGATGPGGIGAGGGGGGFKSSFMAGFTGPQQTPQAQMLGQTARVALLYGVAYRAISMLQQGIEGAIKETVAYEESLTNLNIVTGRNRAENEALANTLGDISVAAGFTPSQGVALGSKALGLYGVAGSDVSQATQEHTIEVSAAVASRMARVAGADPITTQQQLAGALRSLGWGVDRLPELEDTISFISRQTGQAPTELLGAVSNIATLGTQSGFSPQMLAALVAQVGTTTGQNPESTAGQFRQLLSRNVTELAPKAEEILGAELNANSLQELFAAVGARQAAGQVSTDQLNRFASLFGKGGSQQVATILTQQYGAVQNLAANAQDAQGFGQNAFNEAMGSVGNKLKEFGATVADFGVTLVESGVLDWMGAVIIAATELTQAGTALLDVFNTLPRPLRAVALAAGELYLASVAMSRLGFSRNIFFGGALAQAASLTPWGSNQAGKGAIGPRMENGRFVSNTASVLPAFLQRGGGLFLSRADQAQLGYMGTGRYDALRARTGMTGLGLGLAGAGAALAVGATVVKGFEVDSAANEKVQEARAAAAAAVSLNDLRDAAALAANGVQDLKNQGLDGLKVGDVSNLIPALLTTMLTGGERDELQRIADDTKARADALEKSQQQMESADKSNAFQDLSKDGIAATMQKLGDEGYNAQQRLELLNKAMFDFVDSAGSMKDAVAVIHPEEFGGIGAQVGQKGIDALKRVQSNLQISADVADAKNVFGDNVAADVFTSLPVGMGVNALAKKMPWSDAARTAGDVSALDLTAEEQNALREALGTATVNSLKANVGPNGVLKEMDSKDVVRDAVNGLQNSLSPERFDELVRTGQLELLKTYMEQGVNSIIAAHGGKPTRENLGSYLQGIQGNAEASGQFVAAMTGSDAAGNEETLRQLQMAKQKALDVVRGSGQAMTDEEVRDMQLVDLQIKVAKRQYVSDRLKAIKDLTGFRQSMLADDDTFGRLAEEAAGLAASRSVIDEQGKNFGYNYNLGTYVPPTADYSQQNRDQTAAEAAHARAQRAAEREAAASQALSKYSGGDALGREMQAITNAEIALADMTEGSPEYWAAVDALEQQKFAYAQHQWQNIGSNALSRIDPRNNIARLNQQIKNDTVQMLLLPPDQRGELRDSINQQRDQVRQANIAAANARATAGIAGNRSSLMQGAVGIENARRSLAGQLPGTEAYYSALGSLREAQAGLAQAEREQADRVRRLGSDLTNPVEQARLDVLKARDQLAADQTSGQGRDIIDQDKLDLQSAQNNAEAQAFNQRISDLQTAEDLGRISHSAYMDYLQSEHDRLAAVANRTRQQQEQLDQVDKLMKSAAEELNGQFNIGDIDLPTIYEVRRAMQSGAPTSVTDYSNSNNVVNINGANFDQVVAWLMEYMGGNAQVVRSAPRRA